MRRKLLQYSWDVRTDETISLTTVAYQMCRDSSIGRREAMKMMSPIADLKDCVTDREARSRNAENDDEERTDDQEVSQESNKGK
jgi:hypothetical protein